MRRAAVFTLLVALVVAAGAPASAGAGGVCPPSPSGFVLYTIHGQIGDPAPAPGVEPLWDETVVAPLVEMFGSLQAALDALGFASADELYALVLQGWYSWDRNHDQQICMQDLPDTTGTPPFIFNATDNNAKPPS